MALVTCPYCDGKSGHWSSGDGWEEWDECGCCDKDGSNDSGKVSERRLKQYRNELAEEEARWERMVNDYEAAERAMDREYGVCHVY
jgi:hypothetical protein